MQRTISNSPTPNFSTPPLTPVNRTRLISQTSAESSLASSTRPDPLSRLHSNSPGMDVGAGHAWSGLVERENRSTTTFNKELDSLSRSVEGGAHVVRYGDKIRLFSRSHYLPKSSADDPKAGGYVGYYFRSRKGIKGEEGLLLTGRETQYAILAPVGEEKEFSYLLNQIEIVYFD